MLLDDSWDYKTYEWVLRHVLAVSLEQDGMRICLTIRTDADGVKLILSPWQWGAIVNAIDQCERKRLQDFGHGGDIVLYERQGSSFSVYTRKVDKKPKTEYNG